MSVSSSSAVRFKGLLDHHEQKVTALACSPDPSKDTLMSGSADKKMIVWKFVDGLEPKGTYPRLGVAKAALSGHSQRISDLVMASDTNYALSGSWDKTLRLWDLEKGTTLRTYVGHDDRVLSVAFSLDNRQIISSSCDRTIKLWNTLAACKYTMNENQHRGWISCVRFSPTQKQSLVVSSGWDNLVKVWDLAACKLRKDLPGHTGTVESVTISPDGSLCASGGRDGVAMLWDVNEGRHLYSLDAEADITCLCFSPCNYWLCAGTEKSVKIWDLENKNVLAELTPEIGRKAKDLPWCTALTWSADGRTLYVGTHEGFIHVFDASGH